MGFCWFVALAFKSVLKVPVVIVGTLSQPRAELCSVAQVGVGANSSAFKVSSAYIRNIIDHGEGIV
jgi:hypothetical protein